MCRSVTGCSWAGLSAIHQFCKIGAHAFVAGGAILTRDLPPYVMIAGNPAAPHSINSEGLKRRGFTPEQIRNLRMAYRILYRSDLKLAEAIVQLTELAREQCRSAAAARLHRCLHAQPGALTIG